MNGVFVWLVAEEPRERCHNFCRKRRFAPDKIHLVRSDSILFGSCWYSDEIVIFRDHLFNHIIWCWIVFHPRISTNDQWPGIQWRKITGIISTWLSRLVASGQKWINHFGLILAATANSPSLHLHLSLLYYDRWRCRKDIIRVVSTLCSDVDIIIAFKEMSTFCLWRKVYIFVYAIVTYIQSSLSDLSFGNPLEIQGFVK